MLENLLEVSKFCRIPQKDAVQKTLGHCSSCSVFYRTISATKLRRHQLRIERLAGSFIHILKRFRRTIEVLWWNCSPWMCLSSLSRRLQQPFLRSIIFPQCQIISTVAKVHLSLHKCSSGIAGLVKHLPNAPPLPVRVIRIATGLILSKICQWKHEDDVKFKDSVL